MTLGTNLSPRNTSEGKLKKLSTLASQPAPQPSWKEEVNRRLEAHKSRRGLSVVEESSDAEDRGGVSDRAAQAAARVAARFSKAPSYGDMQAAEARAALRTAEAATRVALEAQAAAQVALENLERNAAEHFAYDEEACDASQAYEFDPMSAHETVASSAYSDRSQEFIQERNESSAEAISSGASASETDLLNNPAEELSYPSVQVSAPEDIATPWVEAAKPIHANLIQFPRELVATRRIRPRLADCPPSEAEELYGQLSIFEVDPNTISVGPAEPAGFDATVPAPSWSGPEWSSLELEPEPQPVLEAEPEPQPAAHSIHPASFERRMLAGAIDFALVIGFVCAGVTGMSAHMTHALSVKDAEFGALIAFALVAVFYQAFFLLTTLSTPGMMYAGISLCTLDDEFPTRAQMRNRLGALLVSLLPVGLGFAWSIFDEDHLSWHDRLSRTYQRRC